MSINDIINNPIAQEKWINRAKETADKYYRENPNSLIPQFERELREAGFEFEISNQTLGFMPKHKGIILPIAIKYYRLAKQHNITNEQNHFLSFFNFKGLDEIVPMLLDDFQSKETSDLTRWFIADCLYQIRSRKFTKEYLNIVSSSTFGTDRQMLILLLGKLREECAIPILINLLEDEEVRLHAISALGEFKREDFRCYFERFENSTHPGWRKYAKAALRKLNK